jgi:hypothetical protein
MSFSITPLLIHSQGISAHVRQALASALHADPIARIESLELAAKLLARETDLECEDVRELVGLPGGC